MRPRAATNASHALATYEPFGLSTPTRGNAVSIVPRAPAGRSATRGLSHGGIWAQAVAYAGRRYFDVGRGRAKIDDYCEDNGATGSTQRQNLRA